MPTAGINMLLELLLALNLHVTFTEKPWVDCGAIANGCIYYDRNEIVLTYWADDVNKTLYHEIAHKLFRNDKNVLTFGNKEEICDLFAEYMLNKNNFEINNPSLAIYFRDSLNLWL